MARKFIENDREIICEIDYGASNNVLIRTTKSQYELLSANYAKEQVITMCLNMFEIPLVKFYGESPLSEREKDRIIGVLRKFDG